jgi:hypothetical protein
MLQMPKMAFTGRIAPDNQPNRSTVRAHPRLVILLCAAAMATASSLAFLAFPSVAQASNAIVQIVNQESGQCLQPANGSEGAAIVQETCNGSLVQQWSVTQGEYNAEYADRSTGMCIDAFGAAEDGTSIVQWACASPTISNQRWEFGTQVGSSGQWGELESGIEGSDYDYCLSTPGVQNGDAMLLYYCDWASSQLWSKPSP